MNYDIHVGSILGLPGKILAFLASFVATGLPVTGVAIWWGRRQKAKRKPALKTKEKRQSKPLSDKKAPAFEKAKTTLTP